MTDSLNADVLSSFPIRIYKVKSGKKMAEQESLANFPITKKVLGYF